MRILMTADTIGGVWTYAIELCRALAGHDVEVLLATMGTSLSVWQSQEAKACGNVRVVESRYRLEWMDQPWDDVRDAGQWLLRLRDDFRPDIVHLNGFSHGDLDWDLPTIVVAHSCVLSWWKAVRGESAPESWNSYRSRVTNGARAASIVVAPSQSMLNSVREEYGPFSTDRVIYNARDGSLFRPANKDTCIFSAGRLWDEAKNVRLLQDVADRLIWPVHVAGEQERPDGRLDRGMHGLRFLGRLAPEQMAAAYSRAAIYAAPALYEPFGLSVLEAALSGCALVLGDIPSLREIWADAAIYADPHDREQWIEQLNLLSADPMLRKELSQRSRARASRYTPTRMAEGYVQTYRELLGTPAVRSAGDRPDWAGLHA